jgi:hypothetical protein
MERTEATSYNADRARAVLFGALAKLVVTSRGSLPPELLAEAERALAFAGPVECPADLANVA